MFSYPKVKHSSHGFAEPFLSIYCDYEAVENFGIKFLPLEYNKFSVMIIRKIIWHKMIAQHR